MSDDRARIEDVERDIESTRERMSRTVAELDAAVSARAAAAKDRVDLGRFVGEHPWPSLLLALGAGILLARSGADRRAAHATAEAARRAPAATKRGAARAAAMVRDRLHRDRADQAGPEDATVASANLGDLGDLGDETTRPQDVAVRVSKALHGDELLEDMRGEADRIGRPAPGRPDAEWRSP